MKTHRIILLILGAFLLSSCSTGLESTGPHATLKRTSASLFKKGSISVGINAVDNKEIDIFTSVSLVPGRHGIWIHCFDDRNQGRYIVIADFQAGKTYQFDGKFEAGVFKVDLLELAGEERIVKASYSIPGRARPEKKADFRFRAVPIQRK